MELTQLRYFMAVADSLHMTASAERLHIAQPALSQAIARLERELGVLLFDRTGRHLALTVYGKFLRDRLRLPLAALEGIPREIGELQESEQRTVRLNVLAASPLVTNAIIAYHTRHPEVQFSLLQSNDWPDCDLTVSQAPQGAPIPDGCFSVQERIFLAVPASGKYGARESVALQEVSEESFISLAGSRLLRGICDKLCMQAGFAPHISFESDNLASVFNLIAANAGISFWPELSFGQRGGKAVRLLPISTPECSRQLLITRHGERREGSHAEAFYAFLCDFFTRAWERARAER